MLTCTCARLQGSTGAQATLQRLTNETTMTVSKIQTDVKAKKGQVGRRELLAWARACHRCAQGACLLSFAPCTHAPRPDPICTADCGPPVRLRDHRALRLGAGPSERLSVSRGGWPCSPIFRSILLFPTQFTNIPEQAEGLECWACGERGGWVLDSIVVCAERERDVHLCVRAWTPAVTWIRNSAAFTSARPGFAKWACIFLPISRTRV